MSDLPSQIDRRTLVGSLILLPVLLEGCPSDVRPEPQKPAPAPGEQDLPADGAYRYDFGGDLP